MAEAITHPAFGRTKHGLPDVSKLDAFPNDRYHYGMLGFLQKRREGGGASGAGAAAEGASSSSGFGK